MAITYQKELFYHAMAELPELFQRHWEEVALDRDVIKLEPDWQRYIAMEIAGIVHMLTVRDGKRLVGYYLAIVMPHLHYASSRTAYSDIFYLLPEYREGGQGLKGAGWKLFTETEAMLRALGVQKSYVMTKHHLPITMLMKRLKYRLIEHTYSKLL